MQTTNRSPRRDNSAIKRGSKQAGLGCSIGLTVVVLGVATLAAVFGLRAMNALALPGPTTTTADEALVARREQAAAQLNAYSWVDKEAGIVRIPILQAMALIAEKGLPVGTDSADAIAQAELEPTPTPKPIVLENLPTPTQKLVESDTTPTSTPESSEADTSLPTETPESGSEEAPDIPPTPELTNSEDVPPTETPTPVPASVDLTNVSFQANVLPIFEQHCTECHGGDDPDEGLSLESYADTLDGSAFGSVIEPGNVDGSYLVEQVVEGRMPKRGDPLSPEEIAIIIAWVETGALDN